MSEIKVGEYVRLARNQGINKIIEIDEDFEDYILDYNICDEWGEEISYLKKEELKEEVLKHSPNIIDLIEVFDYVNGCEVVGDKYNYQGKNFINVDSELSYGWGNGVIPEEEIKSIVTAEQFKGMEYRVKEN